MRTIAIVWALTIMLIIYAFSGPLQIRDGRGRIIQGHVATGANVAEPPGYYPATWGQPIYQTLTPRSPK